MVFPRFHIDEIRRQEGRDLTRYDLDFDLPDHFLPEFPGADLPDDAPGPRRRLAGRGRHARELLRAVQRRAQPQAARGAAAARDAVPAAAVQRDGGPSLGPAEPGGRVLRLPRQRAHERGDPSRPRRPPPVVPPPDRDPDAPGRPRPAPLRLATGPAEHRGLHRVRAGGRLLRRRPRDRRQEGGEPPRPGHAGLVHGRVPGAARLPAGPEARDRRQARPASGDRVGAARRRRSSSARRPARPAIRRPTTPTTSCTT